MAAFTTYDDAIAYVAAETGARQRAGRAAQVLAARMTKNYATPAGTVATEAPHDATLTGYIGGADGHTAGTLAVTGAPIETYQGFVRGKSDRDTGGARYQVRFQYDGDVFELMLTGILPAALTQAIVYADGRYVGTFAGNAGADNGRPMHVKVTMPTARRRQYAVWIEGTYLQGIRSQPARAIAAPSLPPTPRVVFATDSFGEGAHADYGRGFVEQLSILSGYTDLRSIGAAGGSGYIADGPGTHTDLATRLQTDVLGQSPDLVVCALGFNDAGQASASLKSAASSVWAQIRQSGARLIAVGPWDTRTVQSYKDVDAALAAQASADGVPYISPQREGWVKADTALINADGAHPNTAGHSIIAAHLAVHLAMNVPLPLPAPHVETADRLRYVTAAPTAVSEPVLDITTGTVYSPNAAGDTVTSLMSATVASMDDATPWYLGNGATMSGGKMTLPHSGQGIIEFTVAPGDIIRASAVIDSSTDVFFNRLLPEPRTNAQGAGAGTLTQPDYTVPAGVTTLRYSLEAYNGTAVVDRIAVGKVTPAQPLKRPITVTPQSVTLWTNPAATTWASQPAALTEMRGLTTDRTKVDLASYTQARVTVAVGATAGNAGSTIAVQYATDGDTQAAWAYLDGASGPAAASSTASKGAASGWVTLAAAAKGDVWLRVVGVGGNGTISPIYGNVTLHLK